MTSSEPSDDTPIVSSDFLQGDVKSGLERMRKRLLDLTSRNRLLNFPQRPSKAVLRFVDELPDELFAALVSGRTLEFKPVPRPRQQYSFSTSDKTELAPDLGESGRESPSAKEHADRLGIATSYDLPLPGTGPVADRHRDRAIQTLHYKEELETILRKISGAARLAIEETGSNMLYLTFGFLEWYESESSEQARLAPLVVLPTSLDRVEKASTVAIPIALRHSGEDVAVNIALPERLKRDFGFSLPMLQEDETPESYWRRVSEAIVGQPRWRVRRQVSLSLLSFGKILMYRDLDPTTWPEGGSPVEHERINEFFRGIQRDAVTYSEDYSLDDETHSPPPMLIDEADSSQHSALIDALNGKNLVIEGPPGTGKSQTITNLIASAMAAGKSVLFVSDKLAALEVVRNRLDKLGLGTFCLELHSHKAQKRQLLDDVEQRLQLHKRFREPAELDSKLMSLSADKRQLSSYVSLINRPFGALGQTLYDLVWSAQRQRASLPFSPELVEGMSVSNAVGITPSALADFHQKAAQFSTHIANVVEGDGGISSHPWFGVRSAELTFADDDRIVASLSRALEAIESVMRGKDAANAGAGSELFPSAQAALQQCVDSISTLPQPPAILHAEILSALKHRHVRRHLTDFIRWVSEYRAKRSKIVAVAGEVPSVSPEERDEIAAVAERCRALLPHGERVADLGTAAKVCSTAATALVAATRAIDLMNRTLGTTVAASDEGGRVALEVLELVKRCPTPALRLRHPGIDAPDAQALLARFRDEADALRKQREILGQRFDLTLAPARRELRDHLAATAEARWWSFLRKDFRAARRAYRLMSRTERASSIEMRDGFRQLHEHATAADQFASNPAVRSVAGPSFDAMDSPFDELFQVCAWRREIEMSLAAHGQVGIQLAVIVQNANDGVLRSLQSAIAGDSAPQSAIRAAHAAKARSSALALNGATAQPNDWLETQGQLESLASTLASLETRLTELRVSPEIPLRQLPDLVRLLTELESLAQLIASTIEVRQVLGVAFRGSDTDVDRIARTLQFFDEVESCAVASHIKEWLYNPDLTRRLELLKRSREIITQQLAKLRENWSAFESLAAVDERQWNEGSAIADDELSSRAARARRALEHRDRLAAWLDFLRSRESLVRIGFEPLALQVEHRRIATDAVTAGIAFIVCNSLVREALAEHPQLARFSGLSHEKVRERFAELDKASMRLYREKAAFLIDRRQVPAGIGTGSVRTYTERHLLEHEISKQRAHVPVRTLMLRAGRALQSLKPCFMMGPLSVAQYLTPGALSFDLVIMDEASQLRPEDALGAISRARQVIIVGDRMQLPPTSFFDRIGDEEPEPDEEVGAVTEAESILDIASATYRPSRMLRWHYRSRHGSLIAFSNKEFYRGKLVVFPSPEPTSPLRGVKLVHVRDGAYEASRNLPEARRVVDTAIRFMERQPNESLGIVAMNVQQRELIEDLLESAIRRSDLAQKYVAELRSGLEPFFVKNLENVQGDERDVIYISNTYGRSPNGQVFQRFGPINGPTGHRRLNVLFTRARNRVVLFSSMLAEDILVQPSSQWGVRALKGYLQFAKTGILETASFSGRAPDSNFEIEVADALRSRGYDVVAQVGIAGYFIDLAVRHPAKSDAFVLGVECDGATYHSGLSVRDRDRLRQQVLEGLGWRIHRIWSTDWFKQPRVELDRMIAVIERLVREEEVASIESFVEHDEVDASTPAEPRGAADSTRWEGELAAQPLSEEDARQQLEALRAEIRLALPGSDPGEELLRDDMIAALLRAKPRSKDDWLKQIAFELRFTTNGDELERYLSRVLEITQRFAG